jgi:rhamnogalacturonyl hydrolase YesR
VACLHAPAGAQVATAARFSAWPTGAEPRDVAKRLAENWDKRSFGFTTNAPGRYDSFVHYAEVATWYGALDVAALLSDRELEQRLVARFKYFETAEGKARISGERHVDFSIFGVIPLELYRHSGDSSRLAFGRSFADRQWENPTATGMSREARYWSVDLYMMTLLQVQAFRATGQRVYLDRMARTMVVYLDSLQQSNGLFYHGAGSPFFWGRGNGWVAAGMTELLRSLPTDHPQRARILAAYRTMMATLLRNQAPSGLWRQLVDRPEVWEESSGSAMFAFAMITGVKQGWLPANEYGPAARRAWIALVGQLDANANVQRVCVGTGKAATEPGVGTDLDAQYRYYVARPTRNGDLHGQAPMLWTAAALLR